MQSNIIVIMSLSGSVVFILYVIIYFLAKKYFSIRWRYTMLKVSLLFYIIPFPWFKYILLNQIYKRTPQIASRFVNNAIEIDITNYIVMDQGAVSVSWKIKLLWFFIAIFGLISVGIICRQIYKYFELKKIYFQAGLHPITKEYEECLEQIKELMGIRKKVKFAFSDFCEAPMTIGVFSPIVIIPMNVEHEPLDDTWIYMIKHELNHIKNRDLPFRFIALCAVAFHWFNPICNFLYYEICNMGEIYCDYCTISDKDEMERKEYCHLLVNMATQYREEKGAKYFAHLANSDARLLERRILEMKLINCKKKVLLSCIVGGLICFTGGTTAFAYTPVSTFTIEDHKFDNENSNDDSIELVSSFSDDKAIEAMPYDDFYYGADGVIHEITEVNTNAKVICPHQYQDIYISRHKKNSDGSCITRIYEGKNCVLCGSIIQGSLYSTTEYTVCPH